MYPCNTLCALFFAPPLLPQGGDVSPAQELAKEKYLSALPFLPPISEGTMSSYYAFYAAFVTSVITFGAIVAPVLEFKLGIGGGTAPEHACVCKCWKPWDWVICFLHSCMHACMHAHAYLCGLLYPAPILSMLSRLQAPRTLTSSTPCTCLHTLQR